MVIPFLLWGVSTVQGHHHIFFTLESLANVRLSQGDRDVIQAGRRAIANFMVVNTTDISQYTSKYEVMLAHSTAYEQHEKPVFYYHFTVQNEIADAPHSFVLYNHRPESLN